MSQDFKNIIRDWDTHILINNYPECSSVGVSYEELYQAIRGRLLNDIVSVKPVEYEADE